MSYTAFTITPKLAEVSIEISAFDKMEFLFRKRIAASLAKGCAPGFPRRYYAIQNGLSLVVLKSHCITAIASISTRAFLGRLPT